MPFVDDLEWQFPDPEHTPHDEALSDDLRASLPFVKHYLWADEDGRCWLEMTGPLSSEEREQIENAGYEVPLQPTISGLHVQYKLVKR